MEICLILVCITVVDSRTDIAILREVEIQKKEKKTHLCQNVYFIHEYSQNKTT